MTDPAEIRAEGRRLLADIAAARETIDGDRVEDAKEAWVNFTYQHHDVLLGRPPQGADPMSPGSTCALVLTRQMVEDLSLAAVVDYRTCLEQGMTHEDAVEQVIEQASESYKCLAGECMH